MAIIAGSTTGVLIVGGAIFAAGYLLGHPGTTAGPAPRGASLTRVTPAPVNTAATPNGSSAECIDQQPAQAGATITTMTVRYRGENAQDQCQHDIATASSWVQAHGGVTVRTTAPTSPPACTGQEGKYQVTVWTDASVAAFVCPALFGS